MREAMEASDRGRSEPRAASEGHRYWGSGNVRAIWRAKSLQESLRTNYSWVAQRPHFDCPALPHSVLPSPQLNCSSLSNHRSQSSFYKPYSNFWLQAPALNLRQGRGSLLCTEPSLSTYPRHSRGRKSTKCFGNIDTLREKSSIKATRDTADPWRHNEQLQRWLSQRCSIERRLQRQRDMGRNEIREAKRKLYPFIVKLFSYRVGQSRSKRCFS